MEGTLDIRVVLRCYPFQEIYEVAQKKLELFSKGDLSSKDFVNEMYDFLRVFDPSLDKQKIFKVFSVLEKFDERKWQDKLCGQAIEMLREIRILLHHLMVKNTTIGPRIKKDTDCLTNGCTTWIL